MLNARIAILLIAIFAVGGAFLVVFDKRTLTVGAGSPLRCTLPPSPAKHSGMVWIPGGSFELGDTVYPEEMPLRKTTVSGFWIDRTEVTNDEFAEFVASTAYVTVAERAVDHQRYPDWPRGMQATGAAVFVPPADVKGLDDVRQWWRVMPGANWRHPAGPTSNIEGRGSFPVVNVTFEDAQAYARWKGRTLPSEAQWEWAARAGQPQPLQDHRQPKLANTWQGLFPVLDAGDDGFAGLAPVGCYPPNARGLFDMIGNVWELTADAYFPRHQESGVIPPYALSAPGSASVPARHVIKGGSFLCASNYCMRYRAGARQGLEDDLGMSHVGFRTILLAPGP